MKALLGIAMLVSLWPVPAAVLVFASDSSDTGSSTRSDNRDAADSSGDATKPRVPQPGSIARSALLPIVRDGNRILDDFEDVPLVEGESAPGFKPRTDRVAAQLDRWQTDFGGLAYPVDRRAAPALRELLVALGDLAESPSQTTLDAYNSALGRYNATVP